MIEPGFHLDIDAAAYHADPAPEPSLSSSVAGLLLSKSALHAKLAHPRLNPHFDLAKQERKRKMDFGSVCHALLIGKGRQIEIIAAENFQTKAARDKRDDAIEAGLIPCLANEYTEAQRMVAAARAQLDGMPECAGAFEHGKGEGEVVMLWQDPFGCWCRGMLDWLTHDGVIYDYKTTASNVWPDPMAIGRVIADRGYDLQEGFYRRGYEQLRPQQAGRVKFRFVFQETEEPYPLVVVELDAVGRAMGERKARASIGLFTKHLQENDWPGYPTGIIQAEYPTFAAANQERRELMDPRYDIMSDDPALPVIRRPKDMHGAMHP